MLKELYLKNYTLAKELSVQFEHGLNIITGESGAGKSVIIGAIDLLLGSRAKSDVIRHGESKAIIEATFDISSQPQVRKALITLEYESTPELILRRELSASGQNRVFINDTPANKTDLALITEHLIDLHGQHDHQRLMNPASHLVFIDALLSDTSVSSVYREQYRELHRLMQMYKKILKQQEEKKERFELIQFQFKEIEDAAISIEDEADLKLEEKQLLSAEEILEAVQKSQEILQGENESLSQALTEIKYQFEYLEKFDSEYSEILNELKSFRTFLSECAFSLQTTQNNVELNPKRLENVQDRLYLYETLKRKYGNSVEDILNYFASIQTEIELSDSLEEELHNLEVQIESKLEDVMQLGRKLTEARKEAALNAERSIVPCFKRLGMENAEIQVAFKPISASFTFQEKHFNFSENGNEEMEFLVKTNKGSTFLPLAKTASGGELSRTMLAFKSMLAEKDKIPLLVFDEIDTGISGKISEAVGNEITELSKYRQILCITHSPQIASKGLHHYKVQKHVFAEHTETIISKLSTKERVMEISQLISAGEITENSKLLAQELLINSGEYNG